MVSPDFAAFTALWIVLYCFPPESSTVRVAAAAELDSKVKVNKMSNIFFIDITEKREREFRI